MATTWEQQERDRELAAQFTLLRTALLALVGVEDELPKLREFEQVMATFPDSDDKRLCMGGIDALIKTHPEYQP